MILKAIWASSKFLSCIFKKRFYVCTFREMGKEGEREGEKHQCVVAFHAPPTGDLARNPGLCPDRKLNQRPFCSQGGPQPTEPRQPGPDRAFLMVVVPNVDPFSAKNKQNWKMCMTAAPSRHPGRPPPRARTPSPFATQSPRWETSAMPHQGPGWPGHLLLCRLWVHEERGCLRGGL